MHYSQSFKLQLINNHNMIYYRTTNYGINVILYFVVYKIKNAVSCIQVLFWF